MQGNHFRRSFTALAIASVIGASGASEAAIYAGRFDPIDFSGTFTITVNDTCLTQNDGWYANSGDCTATLTSALADVISTPSDPDYTGTLTFAPPDISDPGSLYGVYIVNHQLDSFDTGLLDLIGAAPATTDSWWLQFASGQMPGPTCDNYCYGSLLDGVDSLAKGVYLYANTTDTPIATAAYTSVTRIPEPGTLELLGGALLAGWLTLKRPLRAGRSRAT